jgi:hypothetical protein
MTYGPNLPERDREVGHYVGRILKGERTAELSSDSVREIRVRHQHEHSQGTRHRSPHAARPRRRGN